MLKLRAPRLASLLFFTFSCSVFAVTEEYFLTIENHLFYPSELKVPANQKIKLTIINKDDEAEEFDSFDLNREKVIFGNRKGTIYIGPLEPGEYHFIGEYNPNSARGLVIAVSPEQLATEETGVSDAN
ncbi:cupredoxin domain-containing protein [Paraneptunicella aestuarii]|uniref:cupredoxin domain-containing protein n=1 Tax=Paraneptunicella aestuarii TaxID=2831148 RepID=UPI001E45B9A0|nr:cupredoxin domain-containing protein [Paraneptunicella aestuarii]